MKREQQLDLMITRSMDNMFANGKNGTSYGYWKSNPELKNLYDEDGFPKNIANENKPSDTGGGYKTVPTLLSQPPKENNFYVTTKNPLKNEQKKAKKNTEDVPKINHYKANEDIAQATAKFTYTEEKQINKKTDKLKVYKTPASDGGEIEVAGINIVHHPEKFEELKVLVNQGKYEEAEQEAKKYYISYSNPTVKWISAMLSDFYSKNGEPIGEGVGHQLDAMEGLLRDTAFNRGPGRATMWFQRALNDTLGTNLTVDGGMGQKSQSAVVQLLHKMPPEGSEENPDYWVEKLFSSYRKIAIDFEKVQDRKDLEKGMLKRIRERDEFVREILHKNNPINQ